MDNMDIRPTVMNMLIIALIVVVTIPLLKYVTMRVHIPGLSELVASV
jgi:hypothetical protein